jgi:hypothetical protein
MQWLPPLSNSTCRREFPQAKLISPGLIVGQTKDSERFNQIAVDAFRRCDTIGLHFDTQYQIFPAGDTAFGNRLRKAA